MRLLKLKRRPKMNKCYRPILAVDFDGTITKENRFPECGELMPGAQEVLKALHDAGCVIILWTCRTSSTLNDAVAYCKNHGIPIDYVNDNIPEIRGKFADPKIFANYYIDDANIGGFIGWNKVKEIVLRHPFFSYEASLERKENDAS
jgi:hydroxymethylpyrimidine pyrophosphatase-like HAD family hydrolase